MTSVSISRWKTCSQEQALTRFCMGKLADEWGKFYYKLFIRPDGIFFGICYVILQPNITACVTFITTSSCFRLIKNAKFALKQII